MGSFIQQLENNEAVMLVYLAGELPIEDRLEFEQMLAADPKLRLALAELQASQDAVYSHLAAADKIVPLAVSSAGAVRQMSRLMQQRQVEKLTRAVAAPGKKRRHIPRWAYGAASVAAAIVAVVVWWGISGDWSPNNQPPKTEADSSQLDPVQEEQAALMQTIFDNGRNREENIRMFQAEREVAMFIQSDDSDTSPASVFGSSDVTQ